MSGAAGNLLKTEKVYPSEKVIENIVYVKILKGYCDKNRAKNKPQLSATLPYAGFSFK